MIESFARHLLGTTDAWQIDGFDSVARKYLSRLSRERQAARQIDVSGDLLVRRIGTSQTLRGDLAKALATPSWFDPKLGGPRL